MTTNQQQPPEQQKPTTIFLQKAPGFVSKLAGVVGKIFTKPTSYIILALLCLIGYVEIKGTILGCIYSRKPEVIVESTGKKANYKNDENWVECIYFSTPQEERQTCDTKYFKDDTK